MHISIGPVVIGLIAFAWAYVPMTAAAQDMEHFRARPLELALDQFLDDPLELGVRMTAPAGGLWHTPVRWIPDTRGPVLPSLYASLIVLEAYDGYSTTKGLKNGAVESNTFMRRLAAEPAALWAVKGGATFVSIYVAERLWRKGQRGRAIAVMVATNGLMAAVAMNNASVLRTQK